MSTNAVAVVYSYIHMCVCIQHAYAEGLNGIFIAIIYIICACIMYRGLVVLLIF